MPPNPSVVMALKVYKNGACPVNSPLMMMRVFINDVFYGGFPASTRQHFYYLQHELTQDTLKINELQQLVNRNCKIRLEFIASAFNQKKLKALNGTTSFKIVDREIEELEDSDYSNNPWNAYLSENETEQESTFDPEQSYQSSLDNANNQFLIDHSDGEAFEFSESEDFIQSLNNMNNDDNKNNLEENDSDNQPIIMTLPMDISDTEENNNQQTTLNQININNENNQNNDIMQMELFSDSDEPNKSN